MELREFSEIILFSGKEIGGKLVTPQFFTDELPGSAIIAPKFPSRPSNLIFTEGHTNQKISFPNIPELEKEIGRGILLHFFANHELLALELMALFLLKFPNAPKKMRLGVAQTMLEEQEHLQMYLTRMNELGVDFGEVPVNDFFWKHMSTMKSELDFFVKMSLTFEQANLDYALFYKDLMKKIGDMETGSILHKVYEDEIGHVKHGVHWFNHLRDKKESQWTCYSKNLTFPLNPSRAKGLFFSREARVRAGFENDFINSLEIYARSKGRPPHIFLFNPSCELEIAHKKTGFTAKNNMKILVEDFTCLGQYLMANGDVIVATKKPSDSFFKKCSDLGFSLCEFYVLDEISESLLHFPHQTVGHMVPWGWSPLAVEKLKHFYPLSCSENVFQEKIFKEPLFFNNISLLYSKEFSLNLNHKITHELSKRFGDLFANEEEWGQVVEDLVSLQKALNFFLQKHSAVVLKAPLGSSGQNMLIIETINFSKSELGWIQKTFKIQQKIIIEPWCERLVDLSTLFKINEKEMSDNNDHRNKKSKNIQFTRILNNHKGQYSGTLLGKIFYCLDPVVTGNLYNLMDQISGEFFSIFDLFTDVAQSVESELRNLLYEGPVGIDSFVYKDKTSKHGFKIRLISEINPRFTMGMVTHAIIKRVVPNTLSVFLLLNIEKIKSYDIKNVKEFAAYVDEKFPLQVETSSGKPLMKEGVFLAGDTENTEKLIAVLVIGQKTLTEFLQAFPEITVFD